MNEAALTFRKAATTATHGTLREDVLDMFTGPERVLGVIPFVADVSTIPRWHHLVFTEDKMLALPAFLEPGPVGEHLFLPPKAPLAARYPTVEASLAVVAIPCPLTPAHVTASFRYADIHRARLSRDRGAQALPELELRAGRHTSWWFFRTEDDRADREKACYARDLLLALLPFPVQLVGFSDVPRPPEWRLRRGVREPLPLLPFPRNVPRVGPDGPGTASRRIP